MVRSDHASLEPRGSHRSLGWRASKHWIHAGVVALALLSSGTVWGEVARTVDHVRLTIKDILPVAPEGIANLDFGPAPPPGVSRVVTRTEIQDWLQARGVDSRKLAIPDRVRVSTAGRRIPITELTELAWQAVGKALPAGVTLSAVKPGFDVLVPARAEVGGVKMPKAPRQKGPFRATATLEFVCDKEIVARVPVSVTLEVSEEAATPDVARGAKLDLMLSHGLLQITTMGSMLADANVGEHATALVVATGRVVRVRVVSRTEAEILETP